MKSRTSTSVQCPYCKAEGWVEIIWEGEKKIPCPCCDRDFYAQGFISIDGQYRELGDKVKERPRIKKRKLVGSVLLLIWVVYTLFKIGTGTTIDDQIEGLVWFVALLWGALLIAY